ncbi:MAG: ArsR family transcriptional regulator [Armatimonadota bacterium]|nr:ArsR family transcriptional regulator [Armatimonadota bacterium]
MRETRARIVDLLRRRGPLTVEDLARALHVTRTAVIGHLAALQADGFVTRRGLRPGIRRPAVLYGLTPAADALFPKAYEEFAALVLADLKRRSPGHLRRLLRRIADAWIARDLPRVAPLRGRERLTRATEILAERGFMPTLERTRTGYVLREHNCPLMRLAVDHVEVCDMVHRWLEALVGAQLIRVRCLRQGDPYSAYALGPPAEGGRTRRTPARHPGGRPRRAR